MSLFSTNRCKSLSAEYVEELCKAVNETPQMPDVSEPGDTSVVNEAPQMPDVSEPDDASSVVNEAEADDLFIEEALDALLESLNDEE